jgi:hypothetical protein
MTPNPSIERTPYGMLLMPSVAANVERRSQREGSKMSLWEKIFGKRIEISLKDKQGRAATKTVSAAEFGRSQKAGLVSTAATVTVRVADPKGDYEATWVVGRDVPAAIVARFRDDKSGELYAVTYYEAGKPTTSVVLKTKWLQVRQAMGNIEGAVPLEEDEPVSLRMANEQVESTSRPPTVFESFAAVVKYLAAEKMSPEFYEKHAHAIDFTKHFLSTVAVDFPSLETAMRKALPIAVVEGASLIEEAIRSIELPDNDMALMDRRLTEVLRALVPVVDDPLLPGWLQETRWAVRGAFERLDRTNTIFSNP